MGENGALWGGSACGLTIASANIWRLPAVALPGGDLAARQPWRNLLAQCLAFVPDWQDYPQTAAAPAQLAAAGAGHRSRH
jgi:hydrogenase maturation protein HypF